MKALIVSGTDTDVGKTLVSAMLARALDAFYWKPIQAGPPADSARVAELGLDPARILPEAYRLRSPLSPHHAASLDSVAIDVDGLNPPPVPDGHALIIEGAGGLLVPLTETTLEIDLFARWAVPVILVARTGLGTINHTLLALEALARRGMKIKGVVFSGEAEPETERIIARFSGARILGRLPMLASVNAETLSAAFAARFSRTDFDD
jgi:dethiobiotin synthetase